jgi:hypothetical protein
VHLNLVGSHQTPHPSPQPPVATLLQALLAETNTVKMTLHWDRIIQVHAIYKESVCGGVRNFEMGAGVGFRLTLIAAFHQRLQAGVANSVVFVQPPREGTGTQKCLR